MKIYQTYRNSDTTEGRGPMVPDKAFMRKEHADAYIDEQPGVQGRRVKWSTATYADWHVKEIEVLESAYDSTESKINAALAKLTPEERSLLGLK